MKIFLKHIYGLLRNITPDSFNGKLSKFAFSRKPFIKKDDLIISKKFPNKEKGGLIISADFEMAWAWRYTKTGVDHLQKGKIERGNFPKIIKVLEEYNIPITFAIVGHLFLQDCKKGDHEWMKRIPHFNDHWKFTHGDWYDHDPYSNYKEASEWYAPDLIKMIINSKVEHEIGSHTFSHIDFSYKNCPLTVADDEIKACITAAKPFGVDIKSIVFPGGTWGNIEILKKHNLTIYRKRNNFDLAYPYRDEHGLLVSTSSSSLEYNLNYRWSPQYFVNRLKKYVTKAMETNTIAHLWFHPSLDPFILENIFPAFFDFISNERQKGNLWVGPMNKIAEHINRNKII